ncbi:MAG: YebC/PmpR family DNA-binding transcriptional regulator [Clostridia bacterium]|jgi:YebC/PmpR family DNA-binding regulatory protein|nr:YebC/PmpR family DNA-binding transcriptional regulator [Clostridia bacterium]
MAGHSKWANIKHKKAKADEKRGKIFTKIGRELMVAAKEGGPDPEANPRLKTVIQKAKAVNMPNDNIMRNIQKAVGGGDSTNYEEAVYEGYGPGGVAVLLNIMTDNRNRTAGEIRHIFSRNGGSLGETGCVAWMFDNKGVINLKLNEGDDPDAILLEAIEAGAEDVTVDDGIAEIITTPEDFDTVRDTLSGAGYNIESAEYTKIPQNTIEINDPEQAKQVLKLMDLLEDHDDVQDVYANFDIPEELMEQLDQ